MKKLLVGLMLLSVLVMAGCSENKSDTITEEAVSSAIEEKLFKIPLKDVTKTVKKYEYNTNGVTVKFFAVRGSDGKIRTAFDACDVCGGYKGYRQTGNDITCNNCGRVFSIDGLGTKNKGYGCWPSYLGHEIKDGGIVIKTSELEQGKFRFA